MPSLSLGRSHSISTSSTTIAPSHCTPTELITLSSQHASSTQCLFISDVSHSPCVYTKEGFRVFKNDYVQQLWSPGELCILPVAPALLKRVSQGTDRQLYKEEITNLIGKQNDYSSWKLWIGQNQKERTSAIDFYSLPMCQVPQCWSSTSYLKLKYVCMETVQRNGSYYWENLHPLVPSYLILICCFGVMFLAWKILTNRSFHQPNRFTVGRACHIRRGNGKVTADESHTKQHKIDCVPKSHN